MTVWVYLGFTAFALFGYACGRIVGRRVGRKVGFDEGRKAGTFWERWHWMNGDRGPLP